ncbi:MAG: hypothetical protein ABWW70_06705 [Thermoproteota archaeon]
MAGRRNIVIEVDLAKYKYVDVSIEEAYKLLEVLRSKFPKAEADILEVKRYIDNFDEFYSYMKKKFKDYISLPHRPEDYIRGSALIDKVKLYISANGEKRAVLVIDRRVSAESLKELLESLGYAVDIKTS